MVGKRARIAKVFTEKDVRSFAEISMDVNPVHLDIEYAKETIFKKPIAHGFLVGSLISAVIANQLPGPGTIYLQQDLSFKKPVFWNDEIVAEVEVLEEIKPTIYKLKTTCTNQNGEVVIDGIAIVKKV